MCLKALRVLLLAMVGAPLALAQCPFQKLGTPPPGHPDVDTHASPADAAYVSTAHRPRSFLRNRLSERTDGRGAVTL